MEESFRVRIIAIYPTSGGCEVVLTSPPHSIYHLNTGQRI